MSATDHDRDLDERALTEYLSVLDDIGRARGADGLFLVVSQSGKEWLVDIDLERCDCPDHRYRGRRCKHIRRVRFSTGVRPIPSWIDREALDESLGQHIDDGGPRFDAAEVADR